MDTYSDHTEPNNHPPGILFAGLQIVENAIRWLTRLAIPTEQELVEAGVYLGKPYTSEELVDGDVRIGPIDQGYPSP